MRNCRLALFGVVICCLVTLNRSKEISNAFFTSEEDADELSPDEKLRILENSDEMHKIAKSLKSDQEPELTEFSSRVKRNKIDHSVCGKDRNSGGSTDESTHVWPWMAGVNLRGKKEILCGATIISERFVMTAVACVTDLRSYKKKKPEEIVITIGAADGKGGDRAQTLGVRSIHVHPKNSALTFDYDVALVELEKPIRFSLDIGPICLPPAVIPPDSNLYKPQSTGLGLGWGERIDGSPSADNGKNTLKEVELLILHPRECRQSLGTERMKAYFTDRMFCAAEKSPYLCKGDSGAPAMQSQVHPDGYLFWTQVGIMSFGKRCGPNTNGFHTNVHKLLPWILSIAEQD